MTAHALDFDLAASQYASSATLTGLVGNTEGTVAFWCKPETLHSGAVFWIGDTAVTNRFLGIDVQSTGKIRALLYQGAAFDWTITSTSVVYAAGDLLHIALVQDGSSPAFCVNGALIEIGRASCRERG